MTTWFAWISTLLSTQLTMVSCCVNSSVIGNCLKWFSSYLVSRKFQVTVDEELSRLKDLRCGVPQGSVLSPKLFTLFMLPLVDFTFRHEVDFHFYADDCQLYLVFKRNNNLVTSSKLEHLVNDIKSWMINMLKLNDDETEIIILNMVWILTCQL